MPIRARKLIGTIVLLILVVVLLLFGAKRLPEIGASFGKSITAFKRGLSDVERSVREEPRTGSLSQGDTPVREVLQLMRDNRWPFQATIEFEYPVPPGSDRMAELARCTEFCRSCLLGTDPAVTT